VEGRRRGRRSCSCWPTSIILLLSLFMGSCCLLYFPPGAVCYVGYAFRRSVICRCPLSQWGRGGKGEISRAVSHGPVE